MISSRQNLERALVDLECPQDKSQSHGSISEFNELLGIKLVFQLEPTLFYETCSEPEWKLRRSEISWPNSPHSSVKHESISYPDQGASPKEPGFVEFEALGAKVGSVS